jgi:RNA polymerase sigma-70 factor (ECF subfamily)
VEGSHSERVERFRGLYDDLYPRITAYALRRARTREDAFDVVSETFTTLWRRLDDVPEGDAGNAFAFGVARRSLANHYRSADRKAALVERIAAQPAGGDPEDGAVLEALGALGEADREVLTLSVWDGLTNDEVAMALGIKPGTVAVRLHRARTRLGRELAARGVTGGHRVKSEEPIRTPDPSHGTGGQEQTT